VVKIEQIREIPTWDNAAIGMPTNSTLLCVDPNPAQLSLLQDGGYSLVIAIDGHDGRQFLRSRPVDAVVLDHQSGILDGTLIADRIKQIRLMAQVQSPPKCYPA
jgi:CheY-like chemotaxis protein